MRGSDAPMYRRVAQPAASPSRAVQTHLQPSKNGSKKEGEVSRAENGRFPKRNAHLPYKRQQYKGRAATAVVECDRRWSSRWIVTMTAVAENYSTAFSARAFHDGGARGLEQQQSTRAGAPHTEGGEWAPVPMPPRRDEGRAAASSTIIDDALGVSAAPPACTTPDTEDNATMDGRERAPTAAAPDITPEPTRSRGEAAAAVAAPSSTTTTTDETHGTHHLTQADDALFDDSTDVSMGPKGLDTIRIPLEEMTETELKDELRSRRANLSGTKAGLLVRLAEIYLQEDTNVSLGIRDDSMDEDDSSDGASSSEEEDEKMYEVTIVESTVVHLHVTASNEDEARERAMEGEGERVCVGGDWVESVTDVNEM